MHPKANIPFLDSFNLQSDSLCTVLSPLCPLWDIGQLGEGPSPFIPIFMVTHPDQFYLVPGGFWPRFSVAMWYPLQGNIGNTSLIHSENVAHPGYLGYTSLRGRP